MSFKLTGRHGFFYTQKSRFHLIRFVVVFSFVLLGARLVYVQAVLRTDLQKIAQRQHPTANKVQGVRKRILDRHGLTIAETVPVISCFLDPTLVRDKKRTATKLSNLLNVNFTTLYSKLTSKKGSFLWVKRNIPASTVRKVKSLKMPGVAFKTEMRRYYPNGPVGSHLLGIVGIDGVGLSGVEQKFDEALNVARKKKGNYELPVGDVRLTIDLHIQQIAERELHWRAKNIKAKRGMILVQDPKHGDILAMASWPPLSLNPDNPPPSQELRIPPLVDVFEPGSIFKIVTAAAALEEGLARPSDEIFVENGAWDVADITIHDSEEHHTLTFEELLIYSSNIGLAKIAGDLGSTRLYQYARLFGFGVFPGSGLPGEAKGMLRHPSRWSGVSKLAISFGQEVGVSGIQMAGAYSAVANGGVLMEPRIIHSIQDEDGETLWSSEPSKVRRVISQETAHTLKGILAKVVDQGSGRRAQIKWNRDFKAAGKTGTAQKFDSEKNAYHEELTLVSFCGFFPVEKPKYTMVVILDEPEGRRWGGIDAAPVFGRIADHLTPLLALSDVY